jgi:hypothetical protein
MFRAIEPIIRNKAELLREVHNLPLTAAQMEGVSNWIRSSTVKTPEEVRLAVSNALEEAQAFKNIIAAEAPMSDADIFRELAVAANTIDGRIAEYAANLPADKEYGADDKNADMSRATSLAFTMLRGGEPPVGEEQLLGLAARLTSPGMKMMQAQFRELTMDQGILGYPDYGKLNFFRAINETVFMNKNCYEITVDGMTVTFKSTDEYLPSYRTTILDGGMDAEIEVFDVPEPRPESEGSPYGNG